MILNKLLSTCLWNLYTSSKDCLSVRENTRRKPSPDLGDEVEEKAKEGGDNDDQYGDDDHEDVVLTTSYTAPSLPRTPPDQQCPRYRAGQPGDGDGGDDGGDGDGGGEGGGHGRREYDQ